jgi:hypothetical protein
LKAAIAIASEQGSRAFELRAALSLAKLYQSTGRPADAAPSSRRRSEASRRRRRCLRSPKRRGCSPQWREPLGDARTEWAGRPQGPVIGGRREECRRRAGSLGLLRYP